MSHYDVSNESELFKAIEANNAEEVKRIIESAQDKEELLETHSSKKTQKITPVMLAAANGNIPLIEYLIAQGASLEAEDAFGSTPLLAAAEHGQNEVLDYLLTKKIYINERNHDGRTAILVAAQYGQNETFTHLISKGANPNDIDYHGETALLIAVENGQIHTVGYLLNNKIADLDEKDSYEWTALMHASKNGDINMIAYLLKKGARLDVTDNDGSTPLLIAVFHGQNDAIDYLLENGASLDERDNRDRSALILALIGDEAETACHLLKHHSIDIEDFSSIKFSLPPISQFEQAAKLAQPFFEALLQQNFQKVANILASLDESNKKALLQWKYQGKTAGEWCIDTHQLDTLTLSLDFGLNHTMMEEKRTQAKTNIFDNYSVILIHALLRQNYPDLQSQKQLIKKAFFAVELKQSANVLASIIKSCQEIGPYQHHDRQILIEGLSSGALCAGSSFLHINEIVFSATLSRTDNPYEVNYISEETKRLITLLLAQNYEFSTNFTAFKDHIRKLTQDDNAFEDYQRPSQVFLTTIMKESEKNNTLQEETELLQEENKALEDKNACLQETHALLLGKIAELEQQVAKLTIEEDAEKPAQGLLYLHNNNLPQNTSPNENKEKRPDDRLIDRKKTASL